jgi:type IV secretory pathway VirB10-like protein
VIFLDLGRMVGVDKKGTSGLAGQVDNHYDKVAMGLLMSTTVGASVRMTQGKYDSNSASIGQDLGNALAQETGHLGNNDY